MSRLPGPRFNVVIREDAKIPPFPDVDTEETSFLIYSRTLSSGRSKNRTSVSQLGVKCGDRSTTRYPSKFVAPRICPAISDDKLLKLAENI